MTTTWILTVMYLQGNHPPHDLEYETKELCEMAMESVIKLPNTGIKQMCLEKKTITKSIDNQTITGDVVEIRN